MHPTRLPFPILALTVCLGLGLGMVMERARAADLSFVSQIGGSVRAIAMKGDVAVLGEGTRVRTFDSTDPANPLPLGSIQLSGFVERIAVVGNFAYVANDLYGLQVIGIVNPSAPVLRRDLDTPGHASDIVVANGIAYIADEEGGLRIVDVSDPDHPDELADVPTNGSTGGVAVAGTRAYIADGAGGLRILDVSDPEEPVQLGVAGGMVIARGVAVAGNFAYVADSGYGLRVVNIANPASPSEIGGYSEPDFASSYRRVRVNGGLAFVGGGRSVSFDVSTPASPIIQAQGWPYGWDYVSRPPLLHVAAQQSYTIQNLTDPRFPTNVGAIAGAAAAGYFRSHGSIVHAITDGEFRVYDYADPRAPTLLGAVPRPGGSFSVEFDSTPSLVLMGSFIVPGYSDEGGLYLLDVSQPSSPSILEIYPPSVSVLAVCISGTKGFVHTIPAGGSAAELQILDLSVPTSPVAFGPPLVLGVNTPGEIEVEGDRLYSLRPGIGIDIVDVSDPGAPVQVGNYETVDMRYDLEVVGSVAYLALEEAGIRIVDFADPASPVVRGTFQVPIVQGGGPGAGALSVSVQGTLAAVAGGLAGLHLLDVLDPADVDLLETFETPIYVWGAELFGSFLRISDSVEGLITLAVDLPPAILTSPAPEAGGRFGVSVAGSPDMTGDGLPDVLVGAYFEDPGPSPGDSGRTHLFTGGTTLARTIVSPSEATGGNFGRNARSMGDVTGDGKPELIVSAPGETFGGVLRAGRAHQYNGATGALMRSFGSPTPDDNGQFGSRANGMNDVTGDGKNDVFITAHLENPAGSPTDSGRVRIYNGTTGALLRTLASPNAEAGGQFGSNAIGIKDVTGDGRGDLVVGAPGEDPDALGLPTDAGMVYLFNGATGALVWSAKSPAPQSGGGFGRVISRVEDATGDGRMDVAVGCPDENAAGTPTGSGRVHLLNGATGALVRSIRSPSPEAAGGFGQSIANLPDLDGDGRGDLLIGAPYENNAPAVVDAGRAYLFSAYPNTVLEVFESPEPEASAEFGFSVGSVPDTNGDGLIEYVVGARKADPGALPADAGRAYMFYGALLD